MYLKQITLYLLIALHLFSNSTLIFSIFVFPLLWLTFVKNIHDPNSKMTLNRLTALRKSNLFTKYEHAVHKSC